MGYRNLQECVADLEKVGQLRRIDVPVDPYLELAHIQRRAFRSKSPALLFTRVKGCSFPTFSAPRSACTTFFATASPGWKPCWPPRPIRPRP